MTVTVHESATYISMRLALGRKRGPASLHMCACGRQAREWAYDRLDPNELTDAKNGLAFSPHLDHYIALCRECNRGAANERAKGRRAAEYHDKTMQRFDSYVMKLGPDKCWIWTGTIKKHGYGQMWFRGKPDRAHRVSYEIHKGPIPEGLLIRHTCDNKVCVNPNHLITGTNADNVRDAVERGLVPTGSDNGNSKLTWPQVREIRDRCSRGEKQKDIALLFGVSTSTISWIATGQQWKEKGEAA